MGFEQRGLMLAGCELCDAEMCVSNVSEWSVERSKSGDSWTLLSFLPFWKPRTQKHHTKSLHTQKSSRSMY